MDTKTISIIVAIAVFAIILAVGLLTDILKEAKTQLMPAPPVEPTPGTDQPIIRIANEEKSYSFRRLQLWVWTLIICPAFSLHWGYTGDIELNETCLVLIGISVSVTIVAEMISASLITQQKNARLLKTGETYLLKTDLPTSGFWVDILKDDSGQFSIPRLQNLVFTIIFIVIFLVMFFDDNKMSYPDFDETAYVLMGISSGGYLLGKSLRK